LNQDLSCNAIIESNQEPAALYLNLKKRSSRTGILKKFSCWNLDKKT